MSHMKDTVKTVLREGAALGALLSGQLAAAERRQQAGLTVLCYHRVLPEAQRQAYHDPGLVVTPEAFAQHCALLAGRFEVLPFCEAVAQWQNGAAHGRPLAAITFDDGYRDNFLHAAPTLRAHGLRATFFVIAGLVGSTRLPWYDEAGRAWKALAGRGKAPESAASAFAAIAEAKALPMQQRLQWVEDLSAQAQLAPPAEEDLIMTAEQLCRLAEDEHEIGSHSLTHPIVTQCDEDELAMEAGESRERLEDLLQRAVRSFCYPNGNHNARTARALERAGYTCAATMDAGINLQGTSTPLTVQRWFVQQDRLCGVSGTQSRNLMRLEWSGLADSLYRRHAAVGGAG